MEARMAMYASIRNRLCSSSKLIAKVASTNIKVSYQRDINSFPAIRIRVVGGNGDNFSSFIRGDVYIGIYASRNDQPSKELATIYGIVYDLLHDHGSSLTTTNIGVARIWEQHVEYPLWNEDISKYFLTARYSYIAQNRS